MYSKNIMLTLANLRYNWTRSIALVAAGFKLLATILYPEYNLNLILQGHLIFIIWWASKYKFVVKLHLSSLILNFLKWEVYIFIVYMH